MTDTEEVTIAISEDMAGTHVIPRALQVFSGLQDGGLIGNAPGGIEIGEPRPITKEDLAAVEAAKQRAQRAGDEARRKEQETVSGVVKALDLVLEPEAAEDAVGGLLEAYARRRSDPVHARRWLRLQAFKIVANELLRWIAKAASAVRAGK